MKGIIFNFFEEFISESRGEEVLQEIISYCNLKTAEPFVGPGSYPDSDMFEIVSKTAMSLKMPLQDVLRDFGKVLLPKLAHRYPQFITPHKHPKNFLMTVDSVIHVEVRKLYKDAATPQFLFSDPGPNLLNFEYKSKRGFCSLAEGMLDGVSTYYKTPIKFQQTRCMFDGHQSCHFELEFGETN